jgi:ubiquinone/menaquinone biosynthesis C-methylase UbiE
LLAGVSGRFAEWAHMARRDLFKSTATYYTRYRPDYPDELIAKIVAEYSLDGTGTLVDLGCGPGPLLFALAPHFERAIGMDPEPEMLAEAKRIAAERRPPNVSLVDGGWEDLTPKTGPLRLVTMGASFHWMMRRAVLSRLYPMVERGGGVVIIDRGAREGDDFNTVVRGVITKYLGKRRRAGSGFYEKSKIRHERIARLSRFRVDHPLVVPFERTVTVDDVIGYYLSTSSCSPHVLGEHRGAWERDTREALLLMKPGGRFFERRLVEALMLFRD